MNKNSLNLEEQIPIYPPISEAAIDLIEMHFYIIKDLIQQRNFILDNSPVDLSEEEEKSLRDIDKHLEMSEEINELILRRYGIKQFYSIYNNLDYSNK